MTGTGIIVGILVGLALIIIAYFISTQRSLVNLDEMCKNALSQIEVQLNSRWDALNMPSTSLKPLSVSSSSVVARLSIRQRLSTNSRVHSAR